MPYPRPTLTQLRQQVQQDISSALPGSDPLLRFSSLNIMGVVQANLANGNYGFIDWIAQQSNPLTATDEYLEAWAALKSVYRVPAHVSDGSVIWQGLPGAVIPAGTGFVRGDGQAYVTTASATFVDTTVTIAAAAVADPAGLVGAIGNCDARTAMTLSTAIAGVTSTGAAATDFTDGADLEKDDSLRARMLLSYQNPPHGGDATDYVEWALAVPGVTRAWCVPNAFGTGTVAVYVMFDAAEAAHGGFPQGTNGVSQNDHGPNAGAPRDTVAAGDQLTVADAICLVQPVTALVYAMAPTAAPIDFTIGGISTASADTKAAIAAAISSVFQQYGQISAGSSTLPLNYVESAIQAVPGTPGFFISLPAGNITTSTGTLPTLGTVTYAA